MFTMNGQIQLNGKSYFRIDNLSEGTTDLDFLAAPFALIRGSVEMTHAVVEFLNKRDSAVTAGKERDGTLNP